MNTPMLATVLADGDRYGDRDGKGFFFLLTLVLLGVGIFFLVRAIRRRRDGDTLPGRNARMTLDERFARGDIDRAEYEHRRAVLDGNDVIPPAPSRPAPPAPPTASATATVEAPTDGSPETPLPDPATPDDGDAPAGDAAPGDGDDAR